MNAFLRRPRGLYVEEVALQDIAERFGTPCYVYSKAMLVEAFQRLQDSLSTQQHLLCYAVKANPSLAILNVFAKLGAGFDIVSGGELERVLAAGGSADKVVFSGVGKSITEMRLALKAGILCFNVESASELMRLQSVAADMGKVAPISLRVNPDVDAKTHPYIATGLQNNKFGVAYQEALALYRTAATLPNIRISGIDCHIGSQITTTAPFVEALQRILLLVDALEEQGIPLQHLDLGGGIGIDYQNETPPTLQHYAQAILPLLKARHLKLVLEPGRVLVGHAGVLLTRVEYLKPSISKRFAVVDAAMNDLLRPALYAAYHRIEPVLAREGVRHCYDIVGPVCESGDFLGQQRDLCLEEGDLLAILSAGAYGMSMASNYNTRPRAAEVVVDGRQIHLVRARETIADLLRLETLLPDGE